MSEARHATTAPARDANQAEADRARPEQRAASGKAARAKAPLEAHAEFQPATSRDPVALLLGQAKTRVPELVPIRYGRMLVSPFSFYRGAALVMAADLVTTPTPGLRTQLCGDAHLSNFGAYASPERRLVFDLTTSTRPCPAPSNGTSSGWPPAWSWPDASTASPTSKAARRPGRGGELPHRHARLRHPADPGCLVRAPQHRGCPGRVQVHAHRPEVEAGQGRPQGCPEVARQGAHPATACRRSGS